MENLYFRPTIFFLSFSFVLKEDGIDEEKFRQISRRLNKPNRLFIASALVSDSSMQIGKYNFNKIGLILLTAFIFHRL